MIICVHVLSKYNFQHGQSSIHPTNDCISSASGISIKISGIVKCTVKFNNLIIKFKCHVTNESFNLLSLDWINAYLTVSSLLSQYLEGRFRSHLNACIDKQDEIISTKRKELNVDFLIGDTLITSVIDD